MFFERDVGSKKISGIKTNGFRDVLFIWNPGAEKGFRGFSFRGVEILLPLPTEETGSERRRFFSAPLYKKKESGKFRQSVDFVIKMRVDFFFGRVFLVVLFAFATVASDRGASAVSKPSRSDVSLRTGKRQLSLGRGILRGGTSAEGSVFLSDEIPFEAVAIVSPGFDRKKNSEDEDDPGEKDWADFSRALFNFEGTKTQLGAFFFFVRFFLPRKNLQEEERERPTSLPGWEGTPPKSTTKIPWIPLTENPLRDREVE